MTTEIASIIGKLTPDLIQWRRELHRHAESGWTEFWTSAFVADLLGQADWQLTLGTANHAATRLGVPSQVVLEECYQRALSQGANPQWLELMKGGFTGVVADLYPDRTPDIVLRVDLDANELTESSEKSHRPVEEGFSSLNSGVMHGCGHDAHTALGLGVALALQYYKKRLKHNVRLIFQPAEEGVRGAKSMVEAGVVEGTKAFLGLHIGTKANRSGELVLGTDDFLATSKFDVYFKGETAHAGLQPEQGQNCLLAAANAALNMHAIPRHQDGATRISVGTLEAGTARNVIPGCATMQVETRGETSALDRYMLERAKAIVAHCAALYGANWRFKLQGRAKSCKSSPEMINILQKVATEVDFFPAERVVPQRSFGGSEDASWLLERVQEQGGIASYLLLGSDLISGHHTATFDIDEAVLAPGTEFLLRAILKLDQVLD